MTTLTRSSKTGAFVLVTTDPDIGVSAGLTLSTSPRSMQDPRHVFFTSGVGFRRPAPNPYIVLPLFQYADEQASEALLPLWLDYQHSFGTTTDYDPPCPEGMAYEPFQRLAIEYAVGRRNTIIADEPGTGKTIMALGFSNTIGAGRVLVICPASVRAQWRDQSKKWRLPAFGDVVDVLWPGDAPHPRATITICSYETARSPASAKYLRAQHWDLLVLDEAHYLKTPTAQRTKAIFGAHGEPTPGIAASAERILALTGTPLPNRPRECYTLVHALCPEAINDMSARAFYERFNPQKTFASGYRPERTANLNELNARLRCHLMIRRRKEDVLSQLPPKRYELICVDETAAIKQILAAERLLDIDPDSLGSIDAQLWGQVSVLRRQMGEAKVPFVQAYIGDQLSSGVQKLVVFAYHRTVVGALEKALSRFGVATITGETPSRQREEAKRTFIESDNCRVFLGQLVAAGTGIDGLQLVASDVVFAEASWTPGENEQCVDRLHRMGQGGSVLARFLVAAGSLDEKIIGSAIRKLNVIDTVLDKRL